MLIVSIASSLSVGLTSCRRKTRVVVIPSEARVVGRLENGNYEVTPGFLYERARYEAQLEKELARCMEQRRASR